MIRNKIILFWFVVTFCFLLNAQSLFAARNVTCRAMSAEGKILGVYVHNSKGEPVCDCENPEVPEKYKNACSDSKRAF